MAESPQPSHAIPAYETISSLGRWHMDGTVLVTGATAGIGQELARRLLEQGTRIVVHGRSPERAAAAVERIGGGEVVVADLASFAQVRALVDDVAGRFGELQGLVNNAGIGYNTAPPPGAVDRGRP